MLMKFLCDYHPLPGELVELQVPEHLVEKAKHAPVHPVPPSLVQRNHILRRMANVAAGRPQAPWVGLAFELPGRVDTTALAAAFRKWVLRHDTVLTWFSAEPNTESHSAGVALVRHKVAAENVDVLPVPRGEFTSGEAIQDHLREQFLARTDPMCWPPFTAGAVLREDSSTVYFAVDHAHSDAYSIVLVFHELRLLYQAEVTGTAAVLPEAGSHIDASAEDCARAAELQPGAPEVKSWINFLLAGPPPSFPLSLGVPAGETRSSRSFDLDLLSSEEADAFEKVCKAHGAGFSAGLIAALGVLHHELAGRTEYRGLSVVHTRNEPRWLTTQGWFVNLVPVAFPLTRHGRMLPLPELLEGAGEAFRSACKLARVSPLRVAELSGLPLLPDHSSVLPMVSYIDGRRARGSQDWDAANCCGLYDSSPTNEVMMWVNRRWDRTYVTVTHPDTPQARLNVPYFFGRFRRTLQQIARGGAYADGAVTSTQAGAEARPRALS